MIPTQELTATYLLRHLLATLAYRATRTLENAPDGFGDFAAGSGVMTPREILAHMSTILGFANSQLTSTEFTRPQPGNWEHETKRFYATLAELDKTFSDNLTADSAVVIKMLQGPLIDSLTHVGQLATLRRLAGSPVARDHYIKAEVTVGCVGPDQPAPAVTQKA